MPRRQQIILNDFRGGLNTDAASDHLAPNELTSAINVDYSERGSVRKRNGTRKLNQVSYGKPVTQIFEWTRANGDIVLLAVIDKTLCKINANGSKTDIASVSSDRIRYFALQDRLYFVDGTSYRLYDGWQVIDIEIPKLTLSFFSQAGLLPPDTYKFAVLFRDTAGNYTIASAVEEIPTEEEGYIIIRDIPKPPPNIQERRLIVYNKTSYDPNYRWRFGRSITDRDATALSWTLEGWGEIPSYIESMLSDIIQTPICETVVRHTKSNRIFMAGNEEDKAALYFSEPNDPSVVKQTSVMYPTTDDGEITGLATFIDAVLVFFRRSIWVWRGINPEIDAIWQKIPISIGTASPNSITQITQLLTFLGNGGVYGVSPAAIGQSADINLGSNYVADITGNKVAELIKAVTNHQSVVSAYDSITNKFMMAYCDDGTGVNNKILVLDETLGSYAIWEGIQANDIYCTVDGEILIASDNYILKLDDGYSDVDIATGEPKPIKFETEIRSSFNAPMVKKLFTKCWTQIDGEEETTNFNLKIDVDDKLAYDKEMEITNTGEQVAVKVNRFRATGKQLSVTITNDEQDKGFRLYGFGVEVTPVKSYSRRV